MTPDLLRKLAEAGETLDVEFKSESRQQLPDREIVESVVCLANRTGGGAGWLLIGVEDDGRITGALPRHGSGETDPVRVRSMIANRTRPSQILRIEVVSVEGTDILAIQVPTSRQPVGTADGRYVRRAIGGDGKPACVPFHFHEVQSRQADLGLLDYTALRVPGIGWDALDPREFVRFRGAIRDNEGRADRVLLELGDVDMARALGAVETDGGDVAVRVLGLLLFGREDVIRSAVPAHEVAFQRLAGTQVRVNDFFRWPLLKTMEEMEARHRAHSREEELFVGMARIGVPDYPMTAYREGVANALIHRDYSRLGAVHVQWRDDRLQISSPGGFPEGVRLDNLLVTDPRPRNPLLADAFKRAGIVERTARGIDAIFHAQLRRGRRAPSYERSTEAGVTLVLPGGQANMGLARLIVEEGRDSGQLTLPELLLLDHLVWEGRTTVPEAATVVQGSSSEALRCLLGLAGRGLVEARGKGNGQSFVLSLATHRRLGTQPRHVRQRRPQPFQQEELVLRHVGAHGRIARREVVDLCGIGPAHATRVLGRLVDSGRLVRHGQRRGTWYGPPGA